MELTRAVSRKTRHGLLDAGWYPGRNIDTEPWGTVLIADGFPPLHDAARKFLAEYGGLSFRLSGPGVTCAREPFNLVPTACLGEADRFAAWSERVNRTIVPIGETAETCAYAFLGIDERGEILHVVNWLATYGRLPDALDGLIRGYMPRTIA